MGKPTPSRMTSNTDALSLHTTPDDYDYDDLPSYTDSEAAASSSAQQRERPLIEPPALVNHSRPADEYATVPVDTSRSWTKYGWGQKSYAAETTIRMDERLADPYNLYAYVMDVLRVLPPRPMIHFVGHHHEQREDSKGKKSNERVVDFDIYMSLDQGLRPAFEQDWWLDATVDNSVKAYRGTFRPVRAAGTKSQGVQLSDEPAPDLKEWCERFCADPARLKVFRVTREVRGLDSQQLETLVTGLIRSTEYRGRLDVDFPVEERYVDIYSPHIVNRWRTSWMRFVFYFSMLWIITWPLLFFMTKWYSVYTVVWNFSIPTATGGRRCAVLTEREWFECQRNHIRHMVLNRFNGQADMHPNAVNAYNDTSATSVQRQPSTGNAHIDTAISTVSSGVNIWNQIRSGSTAPSSGAWGYDR